MKFTDRNDAGRRLGEMLLPFGIEQPVVAAMPRGGVPVGAEVARTLQVDFDLVIARKIGAPWEPEYAIGAIAEHGVLILNRSLTSRVGLDRQSIDDLTERERYELARQARLYRGDANPAPLAGRTAILVDDGLATGLTASAGCESLHRRGATRVLLAVPVRSPGSAGKMRAAGFDDVISLIEPREFFAVGLAYVDFTPVTDDEVLDVLSEFGVPERRNRP